MIKNERQYRVTRARAKEFEQALEQLKTRKDDVHPLLRKAQTEGIQSQLEDLQDELKQYEALQSGTRQSFVFQNLDELLTGLTKARIARGLTQKQLGEKLRIKEQQVQRYEATDYAAASASRLTDVMNALEIEVHGTSTVGKEKSSRSRSGRGASTGRATTRSKTAHKTKANY